MEIGTTLSDNNSAYVEIQAGLFRNQETYAFLDAWDDPVSFEFWMPGVTLANFAGEPDRRST